ncbi:ubiquitin-conjugating enzyme family protein [Cryptosporidium muris RN66]|uniref:Ubiquitin-conjugating enzyme family protein n=1 Tax=Cryptosporidium muris (strain RN66) TaxID=441375 RepID=B6AD02_CRYMR|nr:ubiquitin-conjugating enzyme family protein [Cryptosporidium muris RN66]EEA06006.1 ubiquitin-conjugating enzyme family protein [Cryptosporidium muris RN66]|eukprot:XP_002140355.1 ubiquitin-conjugating enzyme family protein [Cryptosporidium muris RN66]
MAANRLSREYKNLEGKFPSNIIARPETRNLLIWHFVLYDFPAETPYFGGIYHGKLIFPKEYPYKAPSIYFLTPNGRFTTNTRLCFSMSDHHPESWNPSWRIETILQAILSVMTDSIEQPMIGREIRGPKERKHLAILSYKFNLSNKVFLELFPEFLKDGHYDPNIGYFYKLQKPSKKGNPRLMKSTFVIFIVLFLILILCHIEIPTFMKLINRIIWTLLSHFE